MRNTIPTPENFCAPIISTNHGTYFKGKRNRWRLQTMPNGLIYAIKKSGGELTYCIHNAHSCVPIRHNIGSHSPLQEILFRFMTPGSKSEKIADAVSDSYTAELGVQPNQAEEFEGLITLRPQTDRIIAAVIEAKAQISSDGTPYITHGEHIVLCDAIPMRIAFAAMEASGGIPFPIESVLTPDGNPYFTITANDLPFHIHVSNASLAETLDDSTAAHAGPVAFHFIDESEALYVEIDFERITILSNESEA